MYYYYFSIVQISFSDEVIVLSRYVASQLLTENHDMLTLRALSLLSFYCIGMNEMSRASCYLAIVERSLSNISNEIVLANCVQTMQHFCNSHRWFNTDWSILFSSNNPIAIQQSQRFPYDKQILENFLANLPYQSLLPETRENSWKVFPQTDPVYFYRQQYSQQLQQKQESNNNQMKIEENNRTDIDSQLPPVIIETSKINESNMRWEW